MVNCQLRNYFKGRGRKWAWSKAEGGGGGLTWPLVLRIFGMVSITFFFAPPPSVEINKYIEKSIQSRTGTIVTNM